MKRICTVIVPLKDNHHRTINLLKYSIFDEFEYIFADGSFGVENEKLFKDFSALNIRYIRFPPDDSIDNFYNKMSKSSQLVETDYVVNLDQGDFLLRDGVLRACNLMKVSNQLSSAAGPTFLARYTHGLMTRPYHSNLTFSISNKSLEEALEAIKNEYTYIWYVVHRANVFSEIWADILNYKFPHPFTEYYPTIKSLSRGMHGWIESPLIIRTVYGPRSWTKHSPDFMANVNGCTSDELLLNFAKICQEETSINENYVYQSFLENYNKIVFPSENSSNYGLDKIGLKKLVSISNKIGLSRHTLRIIAHYSKLVFPASSSDRFFSLFTWRKATSQVSRLSRVSSD